MAMPENKNLLDEIKNSIKGMQDDMQNTYKSLSGVEVTGKSHDGTVTIIMTATYNFVDIQFNESALQGGVKEFKWRIREAWKDLSEKIQQTTQERTLELLQGMDIPDEIRNLELEDQGDQGQGGRGE